MKILIGLLITLIYLCKFGRNCDNNGIEYHLGTKSAYRFVANQNATKLEFNGCSPYKIWMLTRHGTRNPSANFIDKFNTRLPELRDLILKYNSDYNNNNNDGFGLFKSQLEDFKNWKYDLTSSDAKKLNKEGKHEMIDLAERMQSRFPTLLPSVYSNTTYKIRFTHTQRTKKSAQFYSIGLFGKPTAKEVWYPEPTKKDLILRFYKLCKRWQVDVKKNPKTYEERNNFVNGPVMKEALRKVSKKLNFKDDLSFDDVFNMYSACAFETSSNKKRKSPWCYAFEDDTITVMEFSELLKYYWVDMYGYDLTYRQACPTFNDMLKHLQGKQEHPKSTLYFTHSGTLLKVLTHLGLYKDDEPITHNDYDKFKNSTNSISKIDPFANNLAIVSYKCGNKLKLLLLHQEKIMNLPPCPDTELCDIDLVKEYYKESVQSCDFDKLCNN